MKELKFSLLIIALIGIILIPGILAAQESKIVSAENDKLAAQETEVMPVPDESVPSTGMVLLDLLLVRPACVVGALMSTAVCIATMPGAYLTGVGEQSARILVQAPWRFTTGRPLGEFTTYRDNKPITHVER